MAAPEHRVKIDWRRLAAVDLTDFRYHFIHGRDASTATLSNGTSPRGPQLTSDIIDLIYNIANCSVEDEFDVDVLDPNLVKLFKVSQILLNYLVREVQRLSDLESELESHKDLKIENKKLRKLLEIHQQALSFSGVHLTSNPPNGTNTPTDGANGSSNALESEFLQCPFCPKAFFDVNFLKSHVHRRHPRDAVENEGAFELTRRIAAYQQALCPQKKEQDTESEASKKMVETLRGQIEEIKQLLDATQQELNYERQEREQLQERIEMAVQEKVKDLLDSIQEREMNRPSLVITTPSDQPEASRDRSPSPSRFEINDDGGDKEMSFSAEMRIAKHLEKLVMIQTQEMAKIGSSVHTLVSEFRKQGAPSPVYAQSTQPDHALRNPPHQISSSSKEPHFRHPAIPDDSITDIIEKQERRASSASESNITENCENQTHDDSPSSNSASQSSNQSQSAWGSKKSPKNKVPPKAQYKPKEKRSGSLNGQIDQPPDSRFFIEKVTTPTRTPPSTAENTSEKRASIQVDESPEKIRSVIEEQLARRLEKELNSQLSDGTLSKRQYDQVYEKLKASRSNEGPEYNQIRRQIETALEKSLDVDGDEFQLDGEIILRSLLEGQGERKISTEERDDNKERQTDSRQQKNVAKTTATPQFTSQKIQSQQSLDSPSKKSLQDSSKTEVAPFQSPPSVQSSVAASPSIQPSASDTASSSNGTVVRKGLLKVRDPNAMRQKTAAQKRIRFAEHRIEISPDDDSDNNDGDAIEMYDEVISTSTSKASRGWKDDDSEEDSDWKGARPSVQATDKAAPESLTGLNRPKEAPPPVPAIRKTVAPLPKIKSRQPQSGSAGARKHSDMDRDKTEQMMEELLRDTDIDSPRQKFRPNSENKSVQELTQMIEEQLTKRSVQTKPPAGAINTVGTTNSNSSIHDQAKKLGLDYDSDLDF